MMLYVIEPHAETRGEGNGWYEVPEAEATVFAVFADDELEASFPTRAEAEAYVAAARAEETAP
jgi:hypothetical protein